MRWEPGCREVPATDPPDYQPDDTTETATDPAGTVHIVTPDPWTTLCGRPADTWSRHVTAAQMAGLVLWCPLCLSDAEQDEAELRWESYYHPGEGDRGGPDATEYRGVTCSHPHNLPYNDECAVWWLRGTPRWKLAHTNLGGAPDDGV